MGKVVSEMIDSSGNRSVCFVCPRTQSLIVLPLEGNGSSWAWCGDDELPSISPSVRRVIKKNGNRVVVDHFRVEHGVIHYESDCQHDLAGDEMDMRTTDIPDGFDVRAPHERIHEP